MESGRVRKFLVVVDDSPECAAAIYYASRRAYFTGGRVTMLYIVPHADFQHWQAVKEVMEEEAREQAEETLQELAKTVQSDSGALPELEIRSGQTKEQIEELIREDTDIKILVLGAASGKDPGPLVSSIAKGGFVNEAGIRVPVTVVPGHLTRAQIDDLA